MRVELHPAFVLHQRHYRETSLLLEVFSSHHGRVGLVAKGARRPRSGYRNVLRPFCPLLLAWSGRGELGGLTDAETDGPTRILTGRRLASGFYINELLMRTLPRHDAHTRLYSLYDQTLNALAGSDQEEVILRLFEKHLLGELGYGLILDHEVESGTGIEGPRRYYYQEGRGPCVDRPSTSRVVEVHGQTLIALATECFTDPDSLREAKALMRFLLKPLLGTRPLRSRELFIRSG